MSINPWLRSDLIIAFAICMLYIMDRIRSLGNIHGYTI